MGDDAASNANLSDHCFVCKVFFDRNLKRSRRRILRDRDDLVSPFLYLMYFAQRTGTWFALNEVQLNYTPLNLETTKCLQQMFACRKCFEKVIKLEKEVVNFEKEISLMLDQSCDTLMNLNIISGSAERIQQLKNEQEKSKQVKKVKKVSKKKKQKAVKKKKKPDVVQQHPPQQVQKTKQILVVAKGAEGDQQQLLLLQVPTNDSENENSQPVQAMIDHQYHQDEPHHVFLSSNSIPVTTCVTVTSDDQVLEVQFQENDQSEHDEPKQEDESAEYVLSNSSAIDESQEAVSSITSGQTWNEGVVVINDGTLKRKSELVDEADENEEYEIKQITDDIKIHCDKPAKSQKTRRTYSPRSSSPLPPSGESKIVVHLMYGSKQWKRNMEGDLKSIIRDMALGRFEPAGRKIATSEKLCGPVIRNYAKRLVSECKEAARTIRVADHQDVTQLDLKGFTSEVFLKCDKTANLIKSLIPVDPRDTLDEHGATAVIMGIILYMHSMQSNTLQHILSYVLRKAGCNREGFKMLHSLGLTLSYTSILKVMNDLNEAMPDLFNPEKASIDRIEKSIEDVVYKSKTESTEKRDVKRKAGQNSAQESSESDDRNMMYLTYTFNPQSSSTIAYATAPFQNQQSEYTTQFDANSTNVYSE